MRGRGSIPLSVLAVLLVFAAFGCSKNSTSPGFGTVKLRLTDDPADYQQVNLAVTEVSAHFEGGAGESDSTGGWQVLRSEPFDIDLLTLRNGVFATLAVTQVPAGHYSQIRLKLASGSNVVIDGVAHPLKVPSGMESGYKLVGGFDVPAGGLIDLTLDFDAARSIVLTGSGTYILKPTARVIQTQSAGAIAGHVSPDSVATVVYAIQAPDTIGSALTSAGAFTVGALPAGTYSLAFHPATAYRDTTLAGVVVNAGATTQVGTVQLTPQ